MTVGTEPPANRSEAIRPIARAAARARAKRFEFFRSLLDRLDRPIRILDVGGTEAYWRANLGDTENGITVDVVNLGPQKPAELPYLKTLEGDATDLRDTADGTYDVAYSNSVIEHVETWDNQRKMAAEMKRVARSYYVQTPWRHFPLEPHFLFPFIQYLPKGAKYVIAKNWPLARRMYGNAELARLHAQTIR
ncbi:MAG: class I SAM-dependent methyltransferase, partial [Acidobacteriota bacterium]|nr:class I SAM-dependent methyltransferase [Acidobacteriota bacterium]